MIGGLITSTVLSLLVVPAVFTYMDDLEGFVRRVAGEVREKPAEEVPVRAINAAP